MKTLKIRWVLAHEPLSLFLRAAQSFAKALNERAGRQQFDVEIMTLTEYSQRYQGGQTVTKHDLLQLMEAGEVEMSQMYTTWLAEKYNSDMHVLDLPFLFRDHDHAQTVLEGQVGQELLTGLNKKSNVRGLAFTYSGGFRMIPAQRPIRSVADFKDLSLRSNKNPFAMETFRAVGAKPVATEVEDITHGVSQGLFVGGESAWPRVYPLAQNTFSVAMNDTKHSLFLTSMIIQQKFWETLSPEIQKIMQDAAKQAAREERREAIRDGELAKQRARREGIEIVELSETETKKFIEATQVVYKKFEGFFSVDLVKRIKLQ